MIDQYTAFLFAAVFVLFLVGLGVAAFVSIYVIAFVRFVCLYVAQLIEGK